VLATSIDLITYGYEPLIIQIPPEVPHTCFGCSPSNPIGLHLLFYTRYNHPYHEVVSVFSPSVNYSGFPKYTHGGILTTLLDELMAHAVHKAFGRYGVTKSLSLNFLQPAYVDQLILIRGWVDQTQLPSNLQVEKKDIPIQVITNGEIFSLTPKILPNSNHGSQIVLENPIRVDNLGELLTQGSAVMTL
jgi:hypothetical protein